MADIPQGFDFLHALRGHQGSISEISWSPDGQMLASGANDKTICLWSHPQGRLIKILKGHKSFITSLAWSPDGHTVGSGARDRRISLWYVQGSANRPFQTLEGHRNWVQDLAWSPDGQQIASGSKDSTIILWNALNGEFLRRLRHKAPVTSVAWSPDGDKLASSSEDQTICVWQAQNGRLLHTYEGHSKGVTKALWMPDGQHLISSSDDLTIRIWDLKSGYQRRVLEGHEYPIQTLSLSSDARLLASGSEDNLLWIWRTDTWEPVAMLGKTHQASTVFTAFHPSLPTLATHDMKGGMSVHLWYVDEDGLLGTTGSMHSNYYTNAKVVIMGEAGIGKTCLARALMEEPFVPQESTHGMQIWTFDTEVVNQENRERVRRETMLWDLAGQSDYRLVHQLFLDETALGVILFDPTHPDNLFNGVKHWEKAISKAIGEDCPRILVAGRVDRGHPIATEQEIEAFETEHKFLDYIITSAKTGEGVQALRDAITKAIPWDRLPVTSSPDLWKDIRQYLLKRRAGNDVLTRRSDLREAFRTSHPKANFTDAEFDTVISHAQAQGLVWRMSFGDFVLLKPELLNDYASAVVRVARKHPEGLGYSKERDVLEGKIDFEDMERLTDTATEKAMLYTVVELFVHREVALREGELLVFPSKFNRKRPEYPKPLFRQVAYRFAGHVEDIYATLAVRLSYCGVFQLKDLWMNAAEFTDHTGNVCGFALTLVDEGEGIFSIFFEEGVQVSDRVLFLRFIQEHLQRRAIRESVKRERIYRCPNCGEEVIDTRAIERRLKERKPTIACQFCDDMIPLLDNLETQFKTHELLDQIQELEEEVIEKREQEVGVTIADAKKNIGEFDVLCVYNDDDEVRVETIGIALKRYRVNPWIRKWNLPPGRLFQEELERILPAIKSIAIFVGPSGIGPWADMEMRLAISQFVKRKLPVIPVALPGVKTIHKLPLFLREFTWVQFLKKPQYQEALKALVWGITGKRPS